MPTSSIILSAIQCHIGYVHLFHDLLLPPIHPSVVYYARVKPNAQRKTELNSTELDRSVEFSSVFRCALNRRRAATTGDGRRRFLTVKNRRSSSPVFVHRQTLRWLAGSQVCPDCEEPATTADFFAESSQVVAGSMHSGKLNSTEQFSWVQFSSLQFPAVHWALAANYFFKTHKHIAHVEENEPKRNERNIQ